MEPEKKPPVSFDLAIIVITEEEPYEIWQKKGKGKGNKKAAEDADI